MLGIKLSTGRFGPEAGRSAPVGWTVRVRSRLEFRVSYCVCWRNSQINSRDQFVTGLAPSSINIEDYGRLESINRTLNQYKLHLFLGVVLV
jgi:hypothetical protein